MEVVAILKGVAFAEGKPAVKTLLAGSGVRVVRFCLRTGQTVPEHSAPGVILVQLVVGHCTFYDGVVPAEMQPGTLVRLAGGRPHRLEAQEDSVVLVTIFDSPVVG